MPYELAPAVKVSWKVSAASVVNPPALPPRMAEPRRVDDPGVGEVPRHRHAVGDVRDPPLPTQLVPVGPAVAGRPR